jgi:endogenous inhibitor of DNA gyrase (YacG/DUF329 family)
MKHRDQLKSLVENAFDFLHRALVDLETSPKFSVIHFHAAVELFLKARLLAEHWSLVISKKQDADLKRFLAGDFQSVTLDEAADRLEKVVQSGLSRAELDQFRSLARHRNRMVHFFHEVGGRGAVAGMKQAIAMEQLKAWYLLNRLLTERWGNVFGRWKAEVEKVSAALTKHRTYLQVAFEHLEPRLKQMVAGGKQVESCIACGYMAAEVLDTVGLVNRCRCLVCQLEATHLTVSCPHCSEPVEFVDEGFAQCPSCSKKLEPDDLAAILDDDEPGTKAYYEHGMPAHCVACDGLRSVVHHGGKCVCASCLRSYDEDSMHQCNWCGDLNAGDMDDSYSLGCVVCSGRHGSMRDD